MGHWLRTQPRFSLPSLYFLYDLQAENVGSTFRMWVRGPGFVPDPPPHKHWEITPFPEHSPAQKQQTCGPATPPAQVLQGLGSGASPRSRQEDSWSRIGVSGLAPGHLLPHFGSEPSMIISKFKFYILTDGVWRCDFQNH